MFISRNDTFLEKEFLLHKNGKMIELEEIQEPQTIENVEAMELTEPIRIVHKWIFFLGTSPLMDCCFSLGKNIKVYLIFVLLVLFDKIG